jgi:hypothetical protein
VNIYTISQPDLISTGSIGSARLGVSSPCAAGIPGTSLPAASGNASGNAGFGTGPSAVVVHAVPRTRGKVAVAAPPKQLVVPALGDQTNTYNYMTGVIAATGDGASGPPPPREPV